MIGKPYREGFVKNRYVGRTFIMPGQGVRKKSVRQKLNVIGSEFKGRNVLLVDDSIVRGTTSREIVQMARDAGARKVYLASAAPPVRYPNVYGPRQDTMGEAGVKDFIITSWGALVLPKATPPAIVNKISAAVKQVADDPAMKEQFLKAGALAVSLTPRETEDFAAQERTKWKEVIRISGAKME